MTDDLDPRERLALDAWTPMEPPEGFADRVIAVRGARRWLPYAAAAISCGAAAAIIAALLSKPGQALPDAANVALAPEDEIDAAPPVWADAAPPIDYEMIPLPLDAGIPPVLVDARGYYVDGSYFPPPLSDIADYDLEIDPGESFTIHTPTDAASIRVRNASCGGSRVSGLQTPGVINVQLVTDPAFNTTTNLDRNATGMTGATVEAPVGRWIYRVTCGTSSALAASGRVTVVRDDGTGKLPAQPTTISVEPDGKVWHVDYASKIPTILVKRPAGGERFHLVDNKGADRTVFIKDPTTTTVTIDGTTLTDGNYSFWFDRGGVRVGLAATLKVERDTGVQQVSIEAPAVDAVAKDPIDVRGTALDGWSITVDRTVVPIDAQHHFSTTTALNGIRAVAIKAKHAALGVHYFLRRLRTP